MNSNFKYKYEQNKSKILLFLSVIAFSIIILVSALVFIHFKDQKKEAPDDNETIYTEEKADFLLTGNANGRVNLISIDDRTIIDSLTLDVKDAIYRRSNDLKFVVAYANSTFYKIIESNKKLHHKVIFTLDKEMSVKSFCFSDKFLVINSNKKIIIINIESKEMNIIKSGADDMVIVDSVLVYTKGNYICNYHLEKKSRKKIYIGDKTKSLIALKNQVGVINNFGAGNQKTTVLSLNPKTLYINYAYRHDNEKTFPITQQSNDSAIAYIDITKFSEIFYNMIDISKDSKMRTHLKGLSTTEYNKDTIILLHNYLYCYSNNKVEIYNLNSEMVNDSIENISEFFMPIEN